MHVTNVISMSFCAPPRAKSWRQTLKFHSPVSPDPLNARPLRSLGLPKSPPPSKNPRSANVVLFIPIFGTFSLPVFRLYSGESLDEILRSENDRLTEERDQLQQSIRQLEMKLASAAEQPPTSATVDDAAAAAAHLPTKVRTRSKR